MLAARVFEQWLHEDIKVTSRPTALVTVNKAARRADIEHGIYALQVFKLSWPEYASFIRFQ